MPPEQSAREHRPVFIIGFARSGKTVLSQYLREQFGYSTLALDWIRQPDYSSFSVRKNFFDLLLRLYPRGLVIEGDNISGENQSKAEIQNKSDFSKMVRWLRSREAVIVCVGNADTTVEEKTAAIKAYREKNLCWTSQANYGTSQIRSLASRSIRYSEELRAFADEMGVNYVDLRPGYYDQDLKAAGDSILAQVRTDRDRNNEA